MFKRVTYSLFAVLLAVSLTFATDVQTKVNSKSQVVFEQNADVVGQKSSTPDKAQVGSAILIGKTWNAYTTQASYTNQIYYDPFSSLMGIVKRSDLTGPGSGRMYYQVSDDIGQNWTGQLGPMNHPGYVLGRHPNIVLTNPAKSSNLEEVTVVTGWAELSASWYWYVLAGDPVGFMSPTTHLDSTFYPGDEMFVNSAGSAFAVLPLIDYPEDGTNNYLYRSDDGGQSWSRASISYETDFFNDTWNGTKSDINAHGNGYIMVQAQNPDVGAVYHFALKATSDDGDTWDSEWNWVNPYEASYNGGVLGDVVQALNYEVDFITYTPLGSQEASAFFVGTFVDTTDGTNTGIYILDNQSGDWRATQIALVNATSQALPGGLTTLNEVEFGRSENGSVLAVKYADLPAPGADGYDLFVSWYDGETWTAPENFTQTPDINEKYSQTAPRLHNVGGNVWQLITMYTLFGDDDTNDLAESELWFVDGVTATVNPVVSVDGNENLTYQFELKQNYPNPFNPSTSIKYSVPELTNVSLKVYDVLGKEVATLVDAQQTQGVYEVAFDASNLASGMYIYTIKAGNFTSSKKMLLMK